MRAAQPVVHSLRFLTKSQRKRFGYYTALQLFNVSLDLIGILLIGLIFAEVQEGGLAEGSSTKSLWNNYLPSNFFEISEKNSIFLLVLIATFCFITKAVVAPLIHRKILLFLGKISTEFSHDLGVRLFSQDILFNLRRTTQETTFILTTATHLTFQGVLGFFALLISESFLILLTMGLLILLDPILMLFIVVYFSLVILLLLRLSDAFISRESKIMNSAHVKALANLQEALVAYREVFVSQQSGNIVSSVTQNLDESIRARAQLTWVGLLPKYILDTSVILGISIIGTFAYVIYSPGEALTLVGLFLLCASRIMPSFLRLNTGLQGIQNCSDASNRLRSFVLELSNFETKDRIGEDYSPLEDGDGDGVFIAVDSLRFKYPDSKALVIQDLSFEVKQGEFLAIVGQSGSGKSTLVDILMGVLDDPSGSVEIGGLPPRVRIEGKPGLISYVPQSVSLFHRSLLENIALGVPSSEIDLDKVQAAVERAALADLVDSLPLGLSTIVGENGHNFSGGQKQRIGLARAFYSNPQILILDEATSSLDAETEHQISQMLVSLSGELTLIVVAHRLATVQKADKVLYLGGSGFSTVGSFEDLRIRVPNFDVQAKLLGL